jgi:hypothetical protein
LHSPERDALVEQSFLSFLSRHARTLEGLNIIAQVSRSWPESFMQATQPRASCIAHARRGLSTPLHALTCNVSDALRAYTLVLVRALESPLVCEAASSAIETTLRGVIPNQAAHRKALAGAVLQALRHMPNYPELRRLASFVFTADGTSGSEASSLRLGAVSGSGAPVTTAVKQQLALDRLSGPDGNTYAERLTANDFQQLRQVTGLSLESFKAVTDRIRLRATSESWARAAILDLARAPHALEVTTSIRTAALGALVSEARRLGRLTPQIEKEIFAVSAEIPTLPHLGEAVWSVNSEHHS